MHHHRVGTECGWDRVRNRDMTGCALEVGFTGETGSRMLQGEHRKLHGKEGIGSGAWPDGKRM